MEGQGEEGKEGGRGRGAEEEEEGGEEEGGLYVGVVQGGGGASFVVLWGNLRSLVEHGMRVAVKEGGLRMSAFKAEEQGEKDEEATEALEAISRCIHLASSAEHQSLIVPSEALIKNLKRVSTENCWHAVLEELEIETEKNAFGKLRLVTIELRAMRRTIEEEEEKQKALAAATAAAAAIAPPPPPPALISVPAPAAAAAATDPDLRKQYLASAPRACSVF